MSLNDITGNEMRFVLSVLKSPEAEYNASTMARHLGISPMGALKIARRLEKEGILVSRKLGKARFYGLNIGSSYVGQYVKFLLRRESERASPYVKAWISDIKRIKNADAALLFGSVLKKHREAKDIDVVFITSQRKFPGLKKEVEALNQVTIQKVHPIYQTEKDIKENIKKGDRPLLSALKGLVVFGEDVIIRLLRK
jgi:predicted transcriptional regulator